MVRNVARAANPWPPQRRAIDAVPASFEDAVDLLQRRKVDAVILDVFSGSITERRATGLDVLKHWQASGFAAVVLHTALPDEVRRLESVFVRVVPKDARALENLRIALDSLFATKIPQIHRATLEHIDNSLREYMWTFVAPNWEVLKGLVAQPDFVRLLVKRLADQIAVSGVSSVVNSVYSKKDYDSTSSAVHPTEYYVKPPTTSEIRFGDIRVHDGGLMIVLWPSCDLVERDGRCKVEFALCAALTPLSDSPEFQKWRRTRRIRKSSVICLSS